MADAELYRLVSRLEQRVSNLIRPGVIAEVQLDPPRVKVEYDQDSDGNAVVSGWLCYFEQRQGHLQTWNPVEEGEQCLMISPCGDLRLGKVLLGLHNQEHTAISSASNIHALKFDDGSSFEFDRDASAWTISLGSGTATFTGSTYTFNADLVVEGDITQNGDITQTGNLNQTGNTTSSGTVEGATVTDSVGDMAAIRSTYNSHTHTVGSSTSSAPLTPMG